MDRTDRPYVRHVLIRQVYSPVRHLWQPWFKVMNTFEHPRPKTKNEHCWYFVPCINIKEDDDTYAFNRILVQHGIKLKWETKRMGWCWFPSLNVYGMTPMFFPLVLNHFSVELKLFNKVCDPLLEKVSNVDYWDSKVLLTLYFLYYTFYIFL
jgi:hypothetical protein